MVLFFVGWWNSSCNQANVGSTMVTIILPSFKNVFPPPRNWGCHPCEQNMEDFTMWDIRFRNDKIMSMCAATRVIVRVHQHHSHTAADVPEEYKPAAGTEQSTFCSAVKNL